jgi:membrane fusion protein (multidrug efflux system)
MNEFWKKVVLLVGVAVLVGGAVLSGRWLYFRFTHISTDAAYVKADMAEVAPEVPGQVLEVLVEEGERVEAGQLLLRLETENLRAGREQAENRVKQLEDTVRRQQVLVEKTRKLLAASEQAAAAAVQAARAQLTKAQAQQEYLAVQEQRFAALLGDKAVPRARYDEIHAAAVAARADVEAAQQALAAAQAKEAEVRAQKLSLQEAEAGLAEAQAALGQAQAALKQALWAESKGEIRAPMSGLVARIFVRPGDFAAPGRPVLAMYDPATRYVEARFEETKVKRLAVGQKARLKVDALPGLALSGTIRRITPAAAQEFALIPRDVTAGEFTKVTQRVPVELVIDGLENHPEIVPGLSVEVAVRKGSE